jgi:hypothetical protein
MSHYFRTATKCDLTMASKAPMPLYNDGTTVATVDTVADSPLHATTIDTVPNTTLIGDEFQRSRAALDGPRHEDIRLSVKREANVLQHLSRREEQQRQRALEEAALNEKLIASIQTARGNDVLHEHADIEDRDAKLLVSSKPVTMELQDAVGSDTQQISMFEKIKIEEARQLRRATLLGPVAQKIDASYGGSIISLYNALTLDTLLQDDTETPPSVLAAAQQNRFILSGAKDQAPPESFKATQIASTQKAEQLAQRLRDVREQEASEDAARSAVRQLRDADSKTVLRETLEQDHVRREYADSSRLLKIAQHHESSLVGAFDVERRTDPLLPHFPDNVKMAMQFSKKPPHPIDVYQAAVRERMSNTELL